MKKTKTLKLPFIGIESFNGFSIFYHNEGHYNTTFEILNPILEYSGDQEEYYNVHNVFVNIVKNLGEDYIVQKHDIFFTTKFEKREHKDYLSQKFFDNFEGRESKAMKTYLTITRKVKKKKLLNYSKKDFDNFLNTINKIYSLLIEKKFSPKRLSEKEISLLLKNFLSFSFSKKTPSFDNFKIDKEKIEIGNKVLKTISLVDIDELNFPNKVKPYTVEDLGFAFPRDLFSFMSKVPNIDTLVYNQIISIPNQNAEKNALERKKKRHSSMPDPANDLAVEDIENVFTNIAKNNQLLVNTHYSVMLYGENEDVTFATNYLESALFNVAGIIPAKNSFNQYELFISSLIGNSVNLQDYDFFKITLDPAICLFYKESYQLDENSDFQIHFTDRKGVPIAIDTADLPMTTNRINNRNKFILGPSGSGKSFLMNHFIRQYMNYETDVVLVDTGNSYSGICTYFKGRYITYTQEKPITMNPFKISQEEYNEEKREFLKSLIILVWKGVDGSVNAIEDTAITKVIFAYYDDYFTNNRELSYLSFNSFYEFSVKELKNIATKEKVLLDVNSYKFVLQKFYKGGEYQETLNSDVDDTLFDEPFIVFEVDEIKEHKTLFPIVTVIIMDVFLQKMRKRKNRRKVLVIEEAWKAIASPNMASYIVYLYKTARKFNAEIGVVTQELDDIISNPIVKKSIIANSDTIMLLDQKKFRDDYDAIANLLSLSSVERKKIFTINSLDNKDNRGRFKEFYCGRGGFGEVYGVEVSFAEYITYSTEKKEKDSFNHYLLKYDNDYRMALETYIKDFNNSGLNLSRFADKINLSIA